MLFPHRLTLLLLVVGSFSLQAQQLVPFRGSNHWQLFDKSTQQVQAETYQEIVPATCGLLFVQQNNLWGAINSNKRYVLPLQFAEVQQLTTNVLLAHSAKGIQLYDTLGRLITKQWFTEAKAYRDNRALLVVCTDKKKYGIIDEKGRTQLAFTADFAPEHLANGYLRISTQEPNGNKNSGIIDSLFRPVLPMRYTDADLFANAYFLCREQNGTYVLFTKALQEIYRGNSRPATVDSSFILLDKPIGIYVRRTKQELIFNNAYHYQIWPKEELAIFSNDETYWTTIITASGETNTIKGVELSSNPTCTRYFRVNTPDGQQPKKYGLVDQRGKFILPLDTAEITSWNNTFCATSSLQLTTNGKYETLYSLLAIESHESRLAKTYEDIVLFPLGGIALKKNGSYRLYSENMNLLDTREYQQIRMHQQLTTAQTGATLYEVVTRNALNQACVGYVDGACNIVIPPIYREVKLIRDIYNHESQFCRLSASVYDATLLNPTYGRGVLLDCDGQPVGSDPVRGIGSSINNFLMVYGDVLVDGKLKAVFGLMDRNGRIVVQPAYDEVQPVYNTNYLLLKKNGKGALVDPAGQVLTSGIYNYVYTFVNGYFIAAQDQKRGVIDWTGKPITRFAYDDVLAGTFLNGTLFKVSRNKQVFYIDRNGSEYIQQ